MSALTTEELDRIERKCAGHPWHCEVGNRDVLALVAMARRYLALEAKVERVRDVLREISGEDFVENCLDPQRAARIARECLEYEFPEAKR